MKTIWVPVLILLGLSLLPREQFAGPPSEQETTRLAQSLDELVEQQPSTTDPVIRNGKRVKQPSTPVPLKMLTPVAADILKVEEKPLRKLLQDQHEKLSRIVYARLLSSKTKESWTDILKKRKDEDLFLAVQQAGVPLTEIYDQLDHLYNELAFAALDAPLQPDPKETKSSKKEASENP